MRKRTCFGLITMTAVLTGWLVMGLPSRGQVQPVVEKTDPGPAPAVLVILVPGHAASYIDLGAQQGRVAVIRVPAGPGLSALVPLEEEPGRRLRPL